MCATTAEFLGRCAAATKPQNKHERTLLAHAAAGGLVTPCLYGIAMSHHMTTDPATWWTYEEGRLWESAMLATTADDHRGVAWPGTRYQGLPPMRSADETPSDDTIELESLARTHRAIPESAARFGTATIDKTILGRWLHRFARVRSVQWARVDGHRHEIAKRGMPEGGGLATLRLWIAANRIDGIERGLYGYNALDHTLRPVSRHIEEMLALSIASMVGIPGQPAGLIIVSNRVERMGAKYHRIALSIALQNAGACLAAAMIAGKYEGIVVRGNGISPGNQWIESTGIDPRHEAPVSAFAFGRAGDEPRIQEPNNAPPNAESR